MCKIGLVSEQRSSDHHVIVAISSSERTRPLLYGWVIRTFTKKPFEAWEMVLKSGDFQCQMLMLFEWWLTNSGPSRCIVIHFLLLGSPRKGVHKSGTRKPECTLTQWSLWQRYLSTNKTILSKIRLIVSTSTFAHFCLHRMHKTMVTLCEPQHISVNIFNCSHTEGRSWRMHLMDWWSSFTQEVDLYFILLDLHNMVSRDH